MKKRKKSRYQLVSPTHKDKVAPAEIELLHTRALLALRNFTHYGGGEKAIALMDQLFKDYKHTQKHEEYRYVVWKRLQEAIARVKENDSSTDMRKKINSAVAEINQLAKKYGYEKPSKD